MHALKIISLLTLLNLQSVGANFIGDMLQALGDLPGVLQTVEDLQAEVGDLKDKVEQLEGMKDDVLPGIDRICTGISIELDWTPNGVGKIYGDVNTAACGFEDGDNIQYYTSLTGDTLHWDAAGITSIYDPSPSSFRIYLSKAGLTRDAAIGLNWEIQYIGVKLSD